MIQLAFLHVGQGPSQNERLNNNIRIGKEQILAPRTQRSQLQGMVLPQPAGWQFFQVNNF